MCLLVYLIHTVSVSRLDTHRICRYTWYTPYLLVYLVHNVSVLNTHRNGQYTWYTPYLLVDLIYTPYLLVGMLDTHCICQYTWYTPYLSIYLIHTVSVSRLDTHRIIIIIIIIKKDWQCKAGRERLTPYQSEDSTPQHQPTEWKNRKGKQQETKSDRAARPIKRHWPCSWNPPVPHHRTRGH